MSWEDRQWKLDDFEQGYIVVAKNGALIEGLVGRTKVETQDRCGKRNIVKIKYRDFN